ncbi:DUF2771 domain-containing protein [Streptomyces sp. NPDC088337]|uniref:DUF2771 domain-containing protein n=1 Tax=unclassified Streptomyces TaxID=2593676 RepID=UPI002DDC5615|nr:DUF2771 domain-containing protein [Streptomyces sp. NBC_01788]WSB27373.1 DUF2771 domain-containing protein [Streptomyces sp. NBC_01788]
MTVPRSRRAAAALGAVSAGLLLLSACNKPTPLATITVGTNSVSSQTDCYNDGKEIGVLGLKKCLDPKSKSIEKIKVDPDETVRFGVDPSIADKGWTILMNGQPLTDSSNKTYRTIPGSVFFNAQYGASGKSTLVSIKQGENKVSGLWSFLLTKDS